MLRMLQEKYRKKYPFLNNDISEIESFCLITIAKLTKKQLDENKNWKGYIKIAIQNAIRLYLKKHLIRKGMKPYIKKHYIK